MAYEQSVIDAINAQATNSRVRLAMTMGAGLESTWTTRVVNSIGATGPFQILLSVHPGVSTAQAEDPTFATRYMLGEYQAAVGKVSDAMWTSDPKNAAALAAYYAERPEAMYPQSRIDSVWQAMAAKRWGSGGASGPPATGGTAGGTTTDGTEQALFNPLSVSDWRKLMLTGLFVLGGVGLVAAGAWRSVSPASRAKG